MPRRKGLRQSKGGDKGHGRRGRSDNGRQQSRGPAGHGFVQGPSLSDWQSPEDRQDHRVSKSSPRLQSWRRSGVGNPRISRNTETTNNAVGYVYPQIQTLDSIEKAPNKNTLDRLCSEDSYSRAEQELLWANGIVSEALNQQPPIYSEENQECGYADLLSGDSKTWGLGYGSGEKADQVLESIVDTKPGRVLIAVQEIGSSSHKGGKIVEKLQVATSVKVSKLGDDTSGTYQQVIANQADKVGASNYPCMPRKNQVQSVYGGQDTRRKQERINSSKQKGRIKSLYKSDKAYLSIGGVRIYTDKNFESSDGADLDSSDEDLLLFGHKSQNRKRLSWSQQTGASCENTSDESEEDGIFSTSDIDKDIVNDYMANGGGDFSDTDWLLRAVSHEQLFVDHVGVHDDARNGTGICSCKTDNDDSGWVSESSSEGENENEKESRSRFNNLNLEDSGEDDDSGEAVVDSGEAVVDIKLSDKVPNCRNIINRHKKHLISFQLMQHRHGTIKVKRKKGSKKWQHKEMVALKRRQRALLRGFDLSAINSRLEEIVLSEEDLFAFEPMSNKDCVQVQKLASIYHLKSGSQSSGKKRFVIVARTPQTKLPSGLDKNRLLDMLQRDNDMDDTMKLMDKSSESMDSGEKRRMASKQKRVARQAFQSTKATSSDRKKGSVGIKQRSPRSSGKGSARYAGQPVSFVSHGTMLTDGTSCIMVSEDAVMSNGESSESARITAEIASEIQVSRTLQLGKFEAHTKGFGSRMMAKMGFVEGYGLGKEGQGIIQPLEATKRPKSLGLGALNL